MEIVLILLVLAAIAFILATFVVTLSRINLIALGLFLVTVALILGR
jgi:hypothetical protein